MDEEEFIYHNQFPEYVDKMRELTGSLVLAKYNLERLKGRIISGTWSGEAKDNICAYLLIMIQYMNQLCADNLKPCQKMVDALEHMREQMETFDKDSPAVNKLRNIDP